MDQKSSHGIVEGIYISPARGEPVIFAKQIHVVPGMGIEGDRYFYPHAQVDPPHKTGRQLTLIEIEAIEAMNRQDGISITPAQARRNVVTRGVRLNDLVGKYFYVGNVRLLGARLCEPCSYLASRTDSRILQSMTHRGGLRTEIITEGVIEINDMITLPE
jgi:MOSC domain-containing protein YiiM